MFDRVRCSKALVVVATSVALVAGAVGGTAGAARARPGAARGRTGHGRADGANARTLTVLENGNLVTWPQGLDPITNTNAGTDATMEDAIFGTLFRAGPGGKVEGGLARGYTLGNRAMSLVIHLRKGVVFSDGTPFDAAAVAYNIRHDLSGTCTCKPTWTATSITTPNASTVVIHLSARDGAIVDQFIGSDVNWIASPTALQRLGAQAFAEKPVGAGPFKVAGDVFDSKLTLVRNPRYWQAGHPYLAGLVFESAANDESAYEDLRSGAAQAYEGMTTLQLVPAFTSAGLQVTKQATDEANAILLNTLAPPFNNLKAREAVYYATDAPLLDKRLNHDAEPVTESFTSPSGLFYEPKVPGYRTYDLAKARALVKALGGLSFTLNYGAVLGVGEALVETLQTMYEQAGMKVTIAPLTINQLIQDYEARSWQAFQGAVGSWDPSAGTSVEFYFYSRSPFTGVHDARLDRLILQAAATRSPANRAVLYAEIAKVISDDAYMPFLFSYATWNVAAKGVEGPGLTTSTLPSIGEGPMVPWQDVAYR